MSSTSSSRDLSTGPATGPTTGPITSHLAATVAMGDLDLPPSEARAPLDDPATGLLRYRRYTWWGIVSGFVVLLLVPHLPAVTPEPLTPAWQSLRLLSLAVVAVAGFHLIQGRLPLVPPPDGEPEPVLPRGWAVGGGVAAGLVAALGIAGGERILWAATPGMIVALVAAYLAPPVRERFVAAVTVAVVAVSVLTASTLDGQVTSVGPLWSGGIVVFLAVSVFAQLWSWEVTSELDEARQVAGQLAIADERLRFAADLHDIQGHHLQVIALTSELAARLADADPATARGHMREVQRLASEALRDTRELVYGLRRTSLDTELANATGVLAAADIDGRMRLDPAVDEAEPSETCRHLLGLVVREAVTNILRHSDAARAEVHLWLEGPILLLTITNDGVTPARTGASDTPQPPDRSGGLASLAARLAEADGALTWARNGTDFGLRASLPVAAGPKAPA